MGLDMWLLKKKGNEYEKIGYWRKANQVREYFAKFVPEQAHENIAELTVSLEMLDVLELKIKKCLKSRDITVCQNLLPTSSGFFFGSTEYDTFYFEDLESTLPIIQEARKEINKGSHVIYHEWW